MVGRGLLLVISAPSGAGKTTLCNELAANVPELWQSVSYTTRQPRPGDVDGREYRFVAEAVFGPPAVGIAVARRLGVLRDDVQFALALLVRIPLPAFVRAASLGDTRLA